jgi:hypothetical protein
MHEILIEACNLLGGGYMNKSNIYLGGVLALDCAWCLNEPFRKYSGNVEGLHLILPSIIQHKLNLNSQTK